MKRTRAAEIAALGAILLAGALSAFWAFYVPIFQAPDEPAHFDYAMSIYQAGRLVRLSDGKVGWIVSPYTKYLLRASDFDRIAWHSSMRVPKGYGTPQFFASIDAKAPSLRYPPPPNTRISYIVASYPFGFYALEALWMHLVSLFTGSIVTLFFAARLLCVFLLMVGLYFNYRSALELGVPRWISAGLVAAIGLLPLTSFVSSYVQPDNLAYAAASAALFFAIRFGKTQSMGGAVGLGICLGILAVTKYQVFLCVAIPSYVFLALSVARPRRSAAFYAAVTAAAVLPAVVLAGVQHWYVDRPLPPLPVPPSGLSLDHVRSAAAMGPLPALRYLTGTTEGAFIECFVSGGCAATYWQVVGWFDTPIIILNARVEAAIRALISLATIITAVTVLYFFLRNVARLLVAASKGHGYLAFRAAFRDSVFNSYLLFVAFIFLLYVATNNGFGAEGRHWYPVIFATFLCFVWYGPRALSKRHSALTVAATVLLLSYVLLAAGYAVVAVSHRYYGPQTADFIATDPAPPARPLPNAGVLWPIVPAAYHVTGETFPTDFPLGTRLLVEGVVRPEAGVVPAVTAVELDQRAPIPVLGGQYQFRIAEATHNVDLGYSQFYAYINPVGLPEGPHLITAFARPLQGPLGSVAPSRLFFLTPDGKDFSRRFIDALQRASSLRGGFVGATTCKGTMTISHGSATVEPGSVLLLSGRIERRGASQVPPALWLMVDSRPYPARLNPADLSFVGTIPTSDLALGAHRVQAYAVAPDAHSSLRVSQGLRFIVSPGSGGKVFLSKSPAACADSLRELAGTEQLQ